MRDNGIGFEQKYAERIFGLFERLHHSTEYSGSGLGLGVLPANLPKVDGSRILRQLRTHPQCADTPVIIVSSSNASSDRARIAALGTSHYFQKPSELDAFMRLGAVVRVVLDNQPA